jgi:hypothetical protein
MNALIYLDYCGKTKEGDSQHLRTDLGILIFNHGEKSRPGDLR